MSEGSPTQTLHASAVAHGARAALIVGSSGAGKSGLALALMAQGARLVADDRVLLERGQGGRLLAAAPPVLAGMIEARGVGILRQGATSTPAEVVLGVDLDHAPETRMPQLRDITYLGCTLRLISGREVPNLASIVTLLLRGDLQLSD